VKSLLVLYPIQPYTESLMVGAELFATKYARAYQYLIHRRYPDFKNVWVMFSEEGYPERPDMSQLWQGISIKKDDIVCACGTSFAELCGERIYSNPKTILAACPQPIEMLVIGGFHFWDCVEGVAQYAYGQGINVLVDDDLTEFFFFRARKSGGAPSLSSIPLLREKSIEKNRRDIIRSAGPQYLEMVREARKQKPWLLPI